MVLTGRGLVGRSLISVVRAAVRGGAGWVILRERDLAYGERLRLAAELREVVPPGRLIVAGPDPLGGEAVHLAERDPLPSGEVRLVGRSRHGRLSDEDYATLSPIWLTGTKPGYGPALGLAEAARLAGDVPWLALGGVDSGARAAECARAGASGVAVLGAIMRSGDPERTAAELSEAFAAAEAATAAAPPRVGSLVGRAGKSLKLSTGTRSGSTAADRRSKLSTGVVRSS
ncbi:thiamine phosphate synthase [Actinoplanes sp. TRM 88003]|uniref:Thiamine phosphate synthase n=1 Tax=Paractinoplanes aksuensis TaxID=2939490 RepID=A0ABT1DXZ6_9ACTN|nr:thiamine phosphate synthase [Actinoplanes aksuensis]MCO8275731.1 thiamine phosphate synthase [Actinoplanes aksuensis]